MKNTAKEVENMKGNKGNKTKGGGKKNGKAN
jgi:hypothetical protein